MKKAVLTYGLLLGTIICVCMVYMAYRCYNNPYLASNDTVGYSAMLVIFSIIFVGIKNYRDKQLDGFITFGRAFKTGLLITLVAATMYVVVWLILYYGFIPDFIDKYTLHVLHQAKTDGLSASEIQAKAAEMKTFKEMYENPLMVILITYAEAMPMGLLVTLISAGILKRRLKVNVEG